MSELLFAWTFTCFLAPTLSKYNLSSLTIVFSLVAANYFFFLELFNSSTSFSYLFYSFIQAGAKVNVSAGGATPLHIAADNGSPEIINCLLKAGADPNSIDEVCWKLKFLCLYF